MAAIRIALQGKVVAMRCISFFSPGNGASFLVSDYFD
jgi:hypothetical protein